MRHPLPLQFLAARRSITRAASISSLDSIAQALSNSDQLQIILRSPVDKPRNQLIDRSAVRLVHERDMPVTTGARIGELLLALLDRVTIPVAGIDVVGDDAVAEGAHRREHAAARGEVGRAHVGGLLADDVHEGVLEFGHLGRQGGAAEGTEVGGVRPGVRAHLVAAVVGVLERGGLVVDTS